MNTHRMKQVVFGDNCLSLLGDVHYITPFGNFKEDVVAADVMCSIWILCNPLENNPRDLYHPLLHTLLTLTVFCSSVPTCAQVIIPHQWMVDMLQECYKDLLIHLVVLHIFVVNKHVRLVTKQPITK